ncbi:MAG: CAP domain-containing protein [Sharpea porci]|uniref:CAP domain-containing protein n=1 Tax=Sharpea porci TaxID=2652286 RepID=UPI00240A971E|nr:CAP domain-containing protein [Sharpea porci]MDD6712548.1 CAP domain-containing protein [Sharpea porci]
MNEKEKERIKSLFNEMNKIKKDIDESKLEATEKVQKVKENQNTDFDDILAFIHNRKNPTRKTEEVKKDYSNESYVPFENTTSSIKPSHTFTDDQTNNNSMFDSGVFDLFGTSEADNEIRKDEESVMTSNDTVEERKEDDYLEQPDHDDKSSSTSINPMSLFTDEKKEETDTPNLDEINLFGNQERDDDTSKDEEDAVIVEEDHPNDSISDNSMDLFVDEKKEEDDVHNLDDIDLFEDHSSEKAEEVRVDESEEAVVEETSDDEVSRDDDVESETQIEPIPIVPMAPIPDVAPIMPLPPIQEMSEEEKNQQHLQELEEALEEARLKNEEAEAKEKEALDLYNIAVKEADEAAKELSKAKQELDDKTAEYDELNKVIEANKERNQKVKELEERVALAKNAAEQAKNALMSIKKELTTAEKRLTKTTEKAEFLKGSVEQIASGDAYTFKGFLMGLKETADIKRALVLLNGSQKFVDYNGKEGHTKDYVNSHSEKDAMQLDNILTSIDILKRSNEVRKAEGKPELKVSYLLMATAMINADVISMRQTYPRIFIGNAKAEQNLIRTENISLNLDAKDVVNSWYGEKTYLDAAGYTKEQQDSFIANPNKLYASDQQTFNKVGYYLNVVGPYEYVGTGLALYGNSKNAISVDFAQRGSGVSVEEFERQILDYYASLKQNYEEYNNALNASKKAYEKFASITNMLGDCVKDYAIANASITVNQDAYNKIKEEASSVVNESKLAELKNQISLATNTFTLAQKHSQTLEEEKAKVYREYNDAVDASAITSRKLRKANQELSSLKAMLGIEDEVENQEQATSIEDENIIDDVERIIEESAEIDGENIDIHDTFAFLKKKDKKVYEKLHKLDTLAKTDYLSFYKTVRDSLDMYLNVICQANNISLIGTKYNKNGQKYKANKDIADKIKECNERNLLLDLGSVRYKGATNINNQTDGYTFLRLMGNYGAHVENDKPANNYPKMNEGNCVKALEFLFKLYSSLYNNNEKFERETLMIGNYYINQYIDISGNGQFGEYRGIHILGGGARRTKANMRYAIIKKYDKKQVDQNFLFRNIETFNQVAAANGSKLQNMADVREIIPFESKNCDYYYVAYEFVYPPHDLSTDVLSKLSKYDRLRMCEQISNYFSGIHNLPSPIYHRMFTYKSVEVCDLESNGITPFIVGFEFTKFENNPEIGTVSAQFKNTLRKNKKDEYLDKYVQPNAEIKSWEKADIFSMGTLFADVLLGKIKPEIFNELDLEDAGYSSRIIKTIDKMLSDDPNIRPTAIEVQKVFDDELSKWHEEVPA